jgi:hypothetical protein
MTSVPAGPVADRQLHCQYHTHHLRRSPSSDMPETVVNTDARPPVKLNVTGLRSTAALTTRVLGLALAQRASWVASQPSSMPPVIGFSGRAVLQ